MPRRLGFLMGLAFAVIFGCQAAFGSMITPWTWQEFAEHADFVGIVECDRAGTVVARYRVVETWKGSEKAGDRIAIQAGMGFNGPHFPVTLVGERLLVTCFRSSSSDDDGFFCAAYNPCFPRRVPSFSYDLLWGQGAVSLNNPEVPPAFREIGSGRKDLKEVQADFLRYLQMPEEDRAFEALRGLAERWLSHTYVVLPRKPTPEQAEAVLEEQTHRAAARKLVEMWDANALDFKSRADLQMRIEMMVPRSNAVTRRLVNELSRAPKDVIHVVKNGETLEMIAALYKDGEGEGYSAYSIYQANRNVLFSENDPPPPGTRLDIRWRHRLHLACLEDFHAFRPQEPDHPKPPTSEELRNTEQTLGTQREWDHVFWNAATLLLKHRPEPVLRWLREWEAGEDEESLHWTDPYVLGTWAGFHCGGDRAHNLSALLDAREPLVRVAAAVYLAHEDETAGLAALREMAKLPGDAGSWAALSLARRGDRKALERVVEALTTELGGNGSGSLIRTMMTARLAELLSNSAAAAKLPPPSLNSYGMRLEDARAFLDSHPDLVPVDPWLSEIRKLRTD